MRTRVTRIIPFCALCAFLWLGFTPTLSHAQVLGDPPDISQDFQKMENVYFIGNRLADFDGASGSGNIVWDRYLRSSTLSFNKIDVGLTKGKATEFPGTEYDENPALP